MSRAPHQPMSGQPKISLPGVKQMVAVASGKGGVGKSTVAANLAMALLAQGHAVGLLDADIYGPSVPMMLGVPAVDPQTTPFPLTRHGLKLMSMGFLVGPDQPMIWRGPMVDKYLRQFLMVPDWGNLDYLVVDLPPGTGDAQLTLCQHAPLTGAIIVTTPQDVSLIDARKGLKMFEQVNVPILGIVENMSYFVCDQCGKRHDIFRSGGGERCAQELGVPFLGAIPIDPAVTLQGDAGDPIVHAHPDSTVSQAYAALAAVVRKQLDRAQGELRTLPTLEL